ncbi:hypothetical protein VULLAG_LOCUS13596 [Vulpes lagopus]
MKPGRTGGGPSPGPDDEAGGDGAVGARGHLSTLGASNPTPHRGRAGGIDAPGSPRVGMQPRSPGEVYGLGAAERRDSWAPHLAAAPGRTGPRPAGARGSGARKCTQTINLLPRPAPGPSLRPWELRPAAKRCWDPPQLQAGRIRPAAAGAPPAAWGRGSQAPRQRRGRRRKRRGGVEREAGEARRDAHIGRPGCACPRPCLRRCLCSVSGPPTSADGRLS